MADDWDLQAVVRGCSSSSSTSTTSFSSSDSTTACFATPDFYSSTSSSSCFSPFFAVPDPIREKPITAIEELHQLYKPFFPKSHQLSSSLQSTTSTISSSPPSSSSSFSSFVCSSSVNDQRVALDRKPQLQQPAKQPSTTTPRSKKRKNQLKKVCQVPAESLSSDVWAWRKYGQKPIKGSPYPRGYYRCSSSKGCLARKQVERNRSDPAMFIVTYTAEHNHPAPTHRNSLAGSTRQKPYTPQAVAAGDSNMPTTPTKASSPATSVEEDQPVVPQSTTTESKEGRDSALMDEEEQDEFGFSDMAVSDDFFAGLEGLAGPVTGDCYSDHFPASFSLPWLSNNAAAAAGSI